MGIKGLIQQIIQRYPQCRRSLSFYNDTMKCDNLYIDSASLFISATAQNKNEGTELTEEIFRNIMYEFDSLIHLLQPKNTLFIALEGMDYMAKRWQTRQRFYQKNSTKIPSSATYESISNQVEPVLKKFIEEKIKNDPVWKSIKNVYFAGRPVPGEAEIKIFSFIRHMRYSKDYDPNQTHIIYTPDSDLALLSLLSHEPYITLLFPAYRYYSPSTYRNCVHEQNLQITRSSLMTIEISLLREQISLDINNFEERRLDDISFLCLTLGSDFLPPILELKSIKYAQILQCYKDFILKEGKFIIEKGDVVWENFSSFLKHALNYAAELSNKDYSSFVAQFENDYKKRNLPEKETKELAKKVLEGFEWTLQCYERGVPSWTWQYTSYFAPPLTKVIECIDEYHPKFPLPNDKDWDTEPTFLEQYFITLRGTTTLLPQFINELKAKNPLIQKWNLPIEEVKKDPFTRDDSALFMIPIIDIVEIRKYLKEIEPTIPPEWQYLIHNDDVLELKTNTKLVIKNDPSKYFEPINKSTQRPFGIPTFIFPGAKDLQSSVTFSYQNRRDKFFEFKRMVINCKKPKLTSEEVQDLVNKKYCTSFYPYEQRCIIHSICSDEAKKEEITKSFVENYGIHIDKDEPFLLIQPVDNDFDFFIGPVTAYPARFCFPLLQAPRIIKKHPSVFTCKYQSLVINDDERRWVKLYDCCKKFRREFATVKNASCYVFNNKNYRTYSLQLFDNDHVIPFYSKVVNQKDLFITQPAVNYLKEYLDCVGKKCEYKIDKNEAEEIEERVCDVVNRSSTEFPWFIDKNSSFLSIETVHKIEGIKAKPAKTFAEYKGYTTNEFNLCQNVVIIDNRTPAPQGSSGIIVALDQKKEEAWLVMNEFNQGITLGHSLRSFRGMIVSFRSIASTK